MSYIVLSKAVRYNAVEPGPPLSQFAGRVFLIGLMLEWKHGDTPCMLVTPWVYDAHGHGGTIEIPISYCPFCGRKLAGKAEE